MDIFDISYIILWGLAFLQAFVLRDTLRETVWLQRLNREYARTRSDNRLPQGTRAPKFSAPVLDTGKTMALADLMGLSATLIFVSPADVASPLYHELPASIHGLWHRARGNLYIVCSGTAEQCRQLVSALQFGCDHRAGVPILLDHNGRIAASFLVSQTPAAVRLDDQVRVQQYARQLTAEEVEQRRLPVSVKSTAADLSLADDPIRALELADRPLARLQLTENVGRR